MTKNKEKSSCNGLWWKILLLLIGLLLVWYLLAESGEAKILREHQIIIQNDITKIKEIGDNECRITQTYTQLTDCIGSLTPRVEIYKLHLEEMRSFLRSSHTLENKAELIKAVDDELVILAKINYDIETTINNYNLNLQNQQERIDNLTKLIEAISLVV